MRFSRCIINASAIMFVTVVLHTAEGLNTLNIPASWVLFTSEIREDKGFGFYSLLDVILSRAKEYHG